MPGRYANWFAALAGGIALLCAIAAAQSRLDSLVKSNRLIDTGYVESGAPPIVSFTTVALGSFRGLMADMLWLRASTLQDQGKYFEMVQLASWITKLQPRFTGATAYLAWNMAYNISVTFSSPVDRYRWVMRGIELIRDEALTYNPTDPVLYKELGWIYQHKLGNIMDDAQLYYKYEIARTMMKPFGGSDADWPALAAAPKDERSFKRLHPETDQLWEAIYAGGFKSLQELSSKFRETGVMPEAVASACKDKMALNALDSYLRSSWLREVYKLYPETVLAINAKYGKLDWRMPESYAIYWAWLGLERSPNRESIECDRMITQSLAVSFLAGRMIMPDASKPSMDFITVPNLSVVDAIRKSFTEAMERNKGIVTFKSALENFMKDAIVTLYSFGQYSKAREYYEYLGKEYGGQQYKIDFDQFVLAQWLEDMKDASFKQAHDLITALIFRSCIFAAYGESASADAHLKLARLAHRKYEISYKASLARVGMPSFDKMKMEITRNCLQSFPPNMAKLLRAQIEADAIAAGQDPAQVMEALKPKATQPPGGADVTPELKPLK